MSSHASAATLRCACGVDIHAHVVPGHFPAHLAPAGWSSEPAPDAGGRCHRTLRVDGRHYRTVSDACWSAPRRLADFEAMGLSHQVVSPMPELLSYWLDAAVAGPLVRHLNDTTAQLCADGGGRLLGLAAVPLQDVDAAIVELQRAVGTLGLVGVEIGSNVNGRPVGHPSLEPFFAACVALDVPVFVHALKPVGADRLVGPGSLEQVLGYPSDVGLAAASVITSGLLQRLPALRIAFSHGGGTLAALLPRLQKGWQVVPGLAEAVPESPREQARRLFYDTLVFDTATLRHLVDSFGAPALMLGTDHPFNFSEGQPLQRLLDAGFDDATRDALAFGNARRFLGRALAEPAVASRD